LVDRLQATLVEAQAVAPSPLERPIRVFCEDESRFGLLPVQRRRITLHGVKPVGTVQYCFENFYVYGAIEPTTGESFFLELPQLNSALFQIFLNEFAHCYQESVNIILMDNGSCHTAKSLLIPENVRCLFLPPYSPELNPIERLWQDVKEQLAWIVVAQIEALEHHVERILRHYAKGRLQSLTSYAYFIRAVNALCS
jgi:putative transposase